MLTITNPIGALAIFAGLTSDRTDSEKRAAAASAALAIAIILVTVTWGGEYILRIFGVSTAGLQVAGGVIIALMGLSMLHSKSSEMAHTKEERAEAASKPSIGVVPMAMPIVAGPGAITTIILATHHFSTVEARLQISAICVSVAAVIWLCLYFAAPISRRLGVAGMNIVTRIMGIVLTALPFKC